MGHVLDGLRAEAIYNGLITPPMLCLTFLNVFVIFWTFELTFLCLLLHLRYTSTFLLSYFLIIQTEFNSYFGISWRSLLDLS